jgi:hypothetical protein
MRYFARGLSCAVALAEAKLGRFAAAQSRMAEVCAEQIALGVTGLQLGYSYELCARIAIWAGDAAAFRAFAALTAEQYRPGESSVLGALYERLTEEARQANVENVTPGAVHSQAPDSDAAASLLRVTTWFAGCDDRAERAVRALALLCEGEPASRGHLFLMTDSGFRLVASNASHDHITQLSHFAHKRFELEVADTKTMTAMALSATDVQTYGAPWQDRDGTRYQALLLAVPVAAGSRVAGVAMLTDERSPRPKGHAKLVSAVTHALLEAGDAAGVDVE